MSRQYTGMSSPLSASSLNVFKPEPSATSTFVSPVKHGFVERSSYILPYAFEFDSSIMRSQKNTPGSADDHTLSTILSNNAFASDVLCSSWPSEPRQTCSNCCSASTARINASVSLMEMFAPVIFVKSFFASMNLSASGCSIDNDNINAPRLPFCATSFVDVEKRSINDTTPEVVIALLCTSTPSGRMCDKS